MAETGRDHAPAPGLLNAWIVYSVVPPAALVMWLLRDWGLIAPLSIWAIFGVLGGGVALSTGADRWFEAGPNRFRLNVRLASQIAVTTTMIYMLGWGPLLAMGYLVSVQENVARAGSKVWRPAAIWCLVAMACGQAAIAAGLVTSFIHQPAVHGLAILVAVCLICVIRLLGATAAGKEHAEGELRDSEERFRSLVQNASDVICVLDQDLRVSYISGAITKLTGRHPASYIGASALDFIHPDDLLGTDTARLHLVSTPGATLTLEVRARHQDGTWRWVEGTLTNLLEHPSVRGIAANLHDVTERRELAASLQFGAYHDVLTGLPNRRAFLDHLERALNRGRRTGSSVAVLFCDLDRFKLVNDSLGHAVGDELLVAVAGRLTDVMRAGDLVARFAGDEFAVLLADASDAGAAVAAADRMIGSLSTPIPLGERERKVAISVGIAFSHAGDEPGDLLREADLAMYQAKERGRGSWALFDTETERRVLESITLEAELWQAVEREELVALFQPEMDVQTGALVGAEALVRWLHPRRGLVRPDDFIPLAEESDLILSIDRYVLGRACQSLARWREHGVAADMTVSVNLSPRWFRDNERVAEIVELVTASDVRTSDIQLEITERLALGESRQTSEAVMALRAAGFRIAIDDFGAGYSSMAYLSRFHVDALKLDRSFVSSADTSERDAAILRAMVTVGHALGTQLIAEGVQRTSQLDLLRSWGCQRAQGFLFSPAITAGDLLHMLLAAERVPAVDATIGT